MHNPAILFPVFALAAWTGLVLLLIPFARVRAGMRRQIVADDFKYGESNAVPPAVSIPNRNYMNLLEIPMLFYVICMVMLVTNGTTHLLLLLAWAYVALRIVHSLVHLTYNHVIHRLTVFAVSNGVLTAIWVITFLHVLDQSRAW